MILALGLISSSDQKFVRGLRFNPGLSPFVFDFFFQIFLLSFFVISSLLFHFSNKIATCDACVYFVTKKLITSDSTFDTLAASTHLLDSSLPDLHFRLNKIYSRNAIK
jgi:hypothetical protein